VRSAALGAAVAPLIIPSRAWGANSRIRVGQIGCGRIAQGHDMPGVIKSDLADYVAICELDAKRLADGVAIIEKSYAERGVQAPKIRTFDNYRELVARKDIDAVVISTRITGMRSGACRHRGRQGRLSTEAVHHDARRGRDPA
jgi:hypothetical protein